MRVLVVDDEPDAAEALTLLLAPRGFEVKTAATAHEARELVQSWKPAAVLLDLILPDITDLDLLHELRAMAPETHVAMVGCPVARLWMNRGQARMNP